MRNVGLLLAAALLALPAAVSAQTAPVAAPAPAPAPRPEYGTPVTLAQAKAIAMAAEAEARKNGWSVVITILEPSGAEVLTWKMDGTQYGSIAVAEGKARTAAQFRRPSRDFAEGLKAGNQGVLTLGVTAVEGGELILIDGMIAGAIGVSGATSAQDGQVARAGAAVVK